MNTSIVRSALPAILCLLGVALPIGAQERASDTLRELNNEVLRLHGEYLQSARSEGLRPGSAMQLRGNTALSRRSVVLYQLLRTNPAEALELAFSPDAVARLVEAFPAAARYLEQTGPLEGELELVVEDSADMHASRLYGVLTTADGKMDLAFPGESNGDLLSGDFVQADGVRLGDRMAIRSAKTVERSATTTCGPTGEQKIAVILVSFPGYPFPAITPQTISNNLFGTTGRTLNNYWKEASYGLTSASGAVFGPYALDTVYTCDNYYAMRTAAIQAADADVNFQNFTRVFVVFPNPGGCSFAGMANLGCSSFTSAGDGTVSASTAWMVATYFGNTNQTVQLASHEGGHNLGLMHARSRDFSAEALGGVGVAGSINEYGDIHSTMGSWNLGHYNASQKLQLGWLNPANVTTVQAAGAYSVLPTEIAATGIQALKVQRGTGGASWLWVEYRQPIGAYDSTLTSQLFSGALVHYADSVTGSYTDLLDYTTGTSSFTDAALPAGQTWIDAYSNVSLTVNSASASGLNMAVNYGALPCITSAPTVSASPSNPSGNPGANVGFSVTVKNNDSAGCNGAQFTLSSGVPQGWSTSFSVTALTLSPGQSGTVTMTKSIPATANPGTYGVEAIATAATLSTKGLANVSVLAPAPPLTVSIASSAVAYTSKDSARFSASTLSGTAGAAAAKVTFTLTSPTGSKATKSLTSDSAGKAVWTNRFGPNDPKGNYTVTAVSTYGTQSAASNTIVFTLK